MCSIFDTDPIYTTGPDLISTVANRRAHLYSDLLIVRRPEDRQFASHRANGRWKQHWWW